MENDCQTQLLPGVSRTFALTIPQLPEPLRTVVTNAYLLCRIADTIEDDALLTPEQKAKFHQLFRNVLVAEACDREFSSSLLAGLSPGTPPAEYQLISKIPVVISSFRKLTETQQKSLLRCINIMSTGMPEFQRTASVAGLTDLSSMDRYCYYVAGVVGEMLTELFCEHSTQINQHKTQLMPLAVSFGQGLQMTNILKDFWNDRERHVCWLPSDVFSSYGVDLANWPAHSQQHKFNQAYRDLVLVALKHLRNAMEYIYLLPAHETGIRRFTFWAVGMAALTLNNIYCRPHFTTASEVKISRAHVKALILVSNFSCRSNRLLNYLFSFLTRKMI